MKKTLLFAAFLVPALSGISQLNIQAGATFFIQSGATVTVQGDVTSAADIQGPGILQMKGSALQLLNMNGFSIQNLQIDNTNNVSLGGAALIGTSLVFTSGKLQLNTFDLSIATAATVSGFDNTKYVVTNGTGRLVKNSLGAVAFTFPVGFDVTTYNPLTLAQNGTAENMGVRVLQNVLQNGTAGSAFIKEVVAASWDINESVGGNNNVNMTTNWAGSDELPGFNRTKTGVSRYDGVGWDMTNAMTAAAAGGGPYSIARNGVTDLGVFAVGTRPVLIALLFAPKTYLQGAYSGGSMTDGLRNAGLVPLPEPYTGMANFTHSGSGGGETVSAGILAGTATLNDIVDWAFAELRTAGGAVISTRAVLIQRNGNLVDVDGTGTKTPYINFAGELAASGPYHVSIRHRNHLGIRTPATQALSRTVANSYDFSTGAAQAQGSVQVSLGGGVFGMYGGNVNGNTTIRYAGPANDESELLNTILAGNKSAILNSVYHRGDLNMNGNVRYTGPANDESFLLNTVLGGNKSLIITQPF